MAETLTAGEALVRWRAKKGWTQKRAAEQFAVAQSSLSDYEAGRQTPRIDQIMRIAVVTKGAIGPAMWIKPAKRSDSAA